MTTTINKIDDNSVEKVIEHKEVLTKNELLHIKTSLENRLAEVNSMLKLLE